MGEDSLLPSHLSPKTLLGAGGEYREPLGHLSEDKIASQISSRNPDKLRPVIVGLGLQDLDTKRETFFDMMELLQKVI